MTARVAINGFGRVGRLCLRSMLDVPVEKIADLMIANKIKRVPVTQRREAGRHRKRSGYHTGDCHGEAHRDAYAYLRFVRHARLYRIYPAGAKCGAGHKRGSVHLSQLRIVRKRRII
jgi:hypothetical protein